MLEITESVLINKPKKVKAVLDLIRNLGIPVAIDDFGTGYASLSYLQKFPIDVLKIDRSFIDDLSDGSNNTKITKAIIALAKSLELTVVAEGVETQKAWDTVSILGADVVQGFFISCPLPHKQVLSFLNKKACLSM